MTDRDMRDRRRGDRLGHPAARRPRRGLGGFTAWLEADPAHPAAYEEPALADAELDGAGAAARRPEPPLRAGAAPRRCGSAADVLGGAIAAALVGADRLWHARAGRRRPMRSRRGRATAAASTLADGSRIDLNGATRIVLDRDNARFATLERGEALFTVVHDEARPFEVEAGDARLLDLGTVFNVVARARRARGRRRRGRGDLQSGRRGASTCRRA